MPHQQATVYEPVARPQSVVSSPRLASTAPTQAIALAPLVLPTTTKVSPLPTPELGGHQFDLSLQALQHEDASTTSSQQVELVEGAMVSIDGCKMQIMSPLGMGSFGVVWSAECEGVGEVAVKEIYCDSETALSRAVYEAWLLHSLSLSPDEQKVPESHNAYRGPAYVACGRIDVQQACLIRLAMGRLPGEPLDQYLHEQRVQMQAQPSTPAAQGLAQACYLARELLVQLAPTMERVSTLAYHRDVNAHNILIEAKNWNTDTSAEPWYGLVDFGLAVDAATWSLALLLI